jgi:hypothetical protein
MNFDVESSQAVRPGLFQASIDRPGHLTAWIDFDKIAELRGVELADQAIDALSNGPIREMLEVGIDDIGSEIMKAIAEKRQEELDLDPSTNSLEDEFVKGSLGRDFMATLMRILIRIQNYGHGGALLIAPEGELHDLTIKYELDYPRLRTALATQGLHQWESGHCTQAIFDYMDDETERQIPIDLYLRKEIAENGLKDSRSEIEGIVWFVSLLTRVDGLVLLTPDLNVRGFGVEITGKKDPATVKLAADAGASSVKEIDLAGYGTRHRSMFRYCCAHPDSLGLVVSQDGAVRCVAGEGENVLLWDNLKIQQYDFELYRPDEDGVPG